MTEKEKIKIKNMEDLFLYREYLHENPRLTYLFLELTDKCNLSCLHCGSSCDGKRRTFIDTEVLFSCLETVAIDFEPESVMICVTGGEPLMHPDFYKIIEKVIQLGFPWGMTTNGTLITDEVAKKLKELKLESVTISLDGLEEMHDWLRNAKGSFQRVLRAVDALKNAQIPVQITTVVHKKNIHELDDIYALMQELGVVSWRLINLEPIGRALENSELLLSNEELLYLLDFIREKRFSIENKMDVRFGCSHYLSYEYEHEVRDDYFICGSGIYVGSILCNGDIYSCLDIERRPELVQGNIKTDRFSEVWFNKFKEFRVDRTSLCKECMGCNERRYCGGDSTHTWDFDKNRPMLCAKRGIAGA